ncbi:MAG: tRNA (guanosine(46)-N7)-methyltransferase TrmB [Myxococcota bacterium]
MGRTLKTDIPGTDWRRTLEQACEEGVLALFAPELDRPKGLVVEIGFGRGEFLVHLAERDPGQACLGIELSRKRVLKMARRLARMEHTNVRLIEGRGEEVAAEALPEGSVSEFWINFPDPWPKKRHARRRLVQPALIRTLATRLEPGGRLFLATDHVAYAEQMHAALASVELLENAYAPAPWLPEVSDRPRTAYELEWRAEGRPLHFFAYRRRSS